MGYALNSNIQKNDNSFYLVVGNDIFISCDPNVKIEQGISFKNIITNKYLRHYEGEIIESDFNEILIFGYDSTFTSTRLGIYIVLQCSNKNLKNYFICYDTSKNKFIISPSKNKDILIYKFRVYDNLNEINISDNFKENITVLNKKNEIDTLYLQNKMLSENICKKIDTNTNQTLEKIIFYNFQTINKIKEIHIKNKIKSNYALNVFFVVSYQSKFGMETVYEEMKKNDMFNPYIFIISPKDMLFNKSDQYYKDSINAYNFFKNRGYSTIFGYHTKDKTPLYIENLNPDIIIYNNPNIWIHSHFKNIIMNYNFLACYIPYAMSVVNSFTYHYENIDINCSWKQFCANSFDYLTNISKSKYKGLNAVNIGYPKLDQYLKNLNKENIPKKLLNNNKINIIIAPHWSYKTATNLATFHLYYSLFLDFLEKYKEINFIFKPHPDLVYRILGNKDDNNLMSYEQYMQYIENWNNKPNGLYFEGGNYIDLFKISSGLITDCGSFISEYLPANKPCIYLVNPDKKDFHNGFNAYGNSILETYYLAYNKDDIIRYFNQVILSNDDPKKESRNKLIKKEFINMGESGKKIVQHIENILLDNFSLENIQEEDL